MKKTKKQAPDEKYHIGNIEIARFGRYIQLQNNSTEEELNEHVRMMAQSYDDIVRTIDECISNIVAIVSRCDPVLLLKRAWWHNARLMVQIKTEVDIGKKEILSHRMIDYIQSVIVSCPSQSNTCEEASETDWQKLTENVDRLFNTIGLRFHMSRRAKKIAAGENINKTLEEYYYKAQSFWCSIRGDRYVAHNKPYFLALLGPHDAILQDVFNVSVEDVIHLILEVERRNTLAVGDAKRELEEDRERINAWIKDKYGPNITENDYAEAIEKAVVQLGMEERRQEIGNILFGDGLFELKPEGGITKVFLEALSLAPGEDINFFAKGDFKGWPLRVWPIWRKPFLHINGQFLCFDYYSLMDNLYRAIQKLVILKRPVYKQEWNEKQRAITEAWPLDLLTGIMPEAIVTKNVFYPSKEDGKTKWCELDALLRYDDVLFVIEIKGGSFCREPPTTDFDAYTKSLKDLIEKPAAQAARFVDYLESNVEVCLFDESHCEKERLRQSDYCLIVPMAVTLDNFSELAAQAKHLAGLGVLAASRPTWNISIEDLMVCADLFLNHLIFLNYVQIRLTAYASDAVKLNSELDHLGLYLRHYDYVRYIDELSEGHTELVFSGYHKRIDEYYYDLMIDEEHTNPPSQKMPPMCREVLNTMAQQQKSGRRKMASYLLSYDDEGRNNIWEMVENSLARQRIVGHTVPVTGFNDPCIVIFCWISGHIERDAIFARKHAFAAMCASQKSEAWLLEITFSDTGSVTDVDWSFLDVTTLNSQERTSADEDAGTLVHQRFESIFKSGKKKIGRNERCPCGSGKKYKKCHGR